MTEMYVIFYISCLPYYYSIFPFRWNQGVAVLTSLSSLVVPCVVVTTYGATGDGRIVGLTTFCFQRSNWQNIHTRLYWDSFLTEMYMVFFFNFCLNKFFTVYHYSTLSLFSLKAGDRRVDGFFVAVGIVICHWTKCGATGGVVSLTIFCFSVLD